MAHESRSVRAVHAFSQEAAPNQRSSAMSKPAVLPIQEVSGEGENPFQMYDGSPREMKGFSMPVDNKNNQSGFPAITAFQLKPNEIGVPDQLKSQFIPLTSQNIIQTKPVDNWASPVVQRREAGDVRTKLGTMISEEEPSETVQGIGMWAYTGGGYMLINSVLREGFGGRSGANWQRNELEIAAGSLVNASMFAVLDNAYDAGNIAQAEDGEKKTYRGAKHTKDEWQGDMAVGRKIEHSGLISTTLDIDQTHAFSDTDVAYTSLDLLPADAKIGGVTTFIDPLGLDVNHRKDLGDLADKEISDRGISMNPHEKEITVPHKDAYIVQSNTYKNVDGKARWDVVIKRDEEDENDIPASAEDILAHVADTSEHTVGMGYMTDEDAAKEIGAAAQMEEVSTDASLIELGDKLLGEEVVAAAEGAAVEDGGEGDEGDEGDAVAAVDVVNAGGDEEPE